MSAEELPVNSELEKEAPPPAAHRRGSDISPKVARRIRISGIFLLLGMAIEAGSLLSSHPTSFLVFAIFGGACLVLGLAAYLFSLVFTH
jgi:hypothetical protein